MNSLISSMTVIKQLRQIEASIFLAGIKEDTDDQLKVLRKAVTDLVMIVLEMHKEKQKKQGEF